MANVPISTLEASGSTKTNVLKNVMPCIVLADSSSEKNLLVLLDRIALLKAPDTNPEPRDEVAFREQLSGVCRGLQGVQEALISCALTTTTSTPTPDGSRGLAAGTSSVGADIAEADGPAFAGSLALSTLLLEFAVLADEAGQLVPSGYLLVLRFITQIVDALQKEGRMQQSEVEGEDTLLEKLRATLVRAAGDLTRLIMRRTHTL